MNWAKKQKTRTPAVKCILFVLADHADAIGVCWPSLETVAAEASASIETVYRHVKELELNNLIYRADVRGHRKDGSRRTSITVVLHNADAIAHAISLGFDRAHSVDRKATNCVIGQPGKLPSDQPRNLPVACIEPPKVKIEPSGHRRPARSQCCIWIRKGSPEWDSWVAHYKQQGLTQIFSFQSKEEDGEGRYEATRFPQDIRSEFTAWSGVASPGRGEGV